MAWRMGVREEGGGKSREPGSTRGSHGEPQMGHKGATETHGELRKGAKSLGDARRGTKSHGEALGATQGHGGPKRAT